MLHQSNVWLECAINGNWYWSILGFVLWVAVTAILLGITSIEQLTSPGPDRAPGPLMKVPLFYQLSCLSVSLGSLYTYKPTGSCLCCTTRFIMAFVIPKSFVATHL